MTTDKPDLYMSLRHQSDRYSHGGYITLRAVLAFPHERDGTLRYPRWGYDETYRDLAGLTVSAQANLDEPQGSWYAIRVGYDQPSDVQLEQAQAMVATLRRLERHDAKLTEKFGQAVGLGGRIARVADCLGVTRYCWPSERSMSGDGQHWADVQGMGWHLDEILREARPKQAAA